MLRLTLRIFIVFGIWSSAACCFLQYLHGWELDNDIEYTHKPDGQRAGTTQQIHALHRQIDFWGDMALALFWFGAALIAFWIFGYFWRRRMNRRIGFDVIQR